MNRWIEYAKVTAILAVAHAVRGASEWLITVLTLVAFTCAGIGVGVKR